MCGSPLIGVSRTMVREALIRLETRGIVHVSPRRGWFVVEPSLDEAQEAFQARCAIEMGFLYTITTIARSMARTAPPEPSSSKPSGAKATCR